MTSKAKKKYTCGWCGKKCRHYIYATRTVSIYFSGAHGGGSSESIKTIYFCNYQHRINYYREP